MDRRQIHSTQNDKMSKSSLFKTLAFVQIPIIGFLLVLCINFSQQSQPHCDHSKEPTKIVEKHIIINEKEPIESLNMTITAYSATVAQTDETPYKTALMQRPISGWTCAVSRDHVEWLGDRIYIEGVGVREINDLMNEQFTDRVDLFVGNKKQAMEIGKSRHKVVVIE